MPDAAPLCPQCGIALASVKARARTGYLLMLDQCERCGGLWCDKWELFPIDSSEVDRLDPVDRKALQAAGPLRDQLKCPRCAIPLIAFRDPVLPADVCIQRCRLCEGLWLNAGALRRFDARRPRAAARRAIPTDLVASITKAAREPARWSTVQNLSGGTVDSDATPDDVDHRGWFWSGAAALALRALLSLLVRQ